MKLFSPLKSNAGFTAFEIIIVLVLLAMLGLVAYIAHQVYANSPSGPPKHASSISGAAVPSATPQVCEPGNNVDGCKVAGFDITAPVAGAQVCLGSTYEIKWKAPSDMSTVSIAVRVGDSGSAVSVGDAAAADSEYPWQVTGLSPGDSYRIWLNSTYKGFSANTASAGLFTVKDCGANS